MKTDTSLLLVKLYHNCCQIRKWGFTECHRWTMGMLRLAQKSGSEKRDRGYSLRPQNTPNSKTAWTSHLPVLHMYIDLKQTSKECPAQRSICYLGSLLAPIVSLITSLNFPNFPRMLSSLTKELTREFVQQILFVCGQKFQKRPFLTNMGRGKLSWVYFHVASVSVFLDPVPNCLYVEVW